MPYSTFTNLGFGELTPTKLIIELADKTIKRPKGIAENVLVGIDKFVFVVDFVVLDMPEDIKVPLILERPFFSTARAKIDRVYALGLRERTKLDLEARLMGEALILNKSLDLTYGDHIELNDLNEPLELRRNQVEYLGQTIVRGEVIDKSMIKVTRTRNDDEEIEGIDKYPSFCDVDRKIHMDYAYNLQFSCMIECRYGVSNLNGYGILTVWMLSSLYFSAFKTLSLIQSIRHPALRRPQYCPLCSQAHDLLCGPHVKTSRQAHGFALWPSCEDFPAGHPSQYYFHMSTLNCQFLGTPLATSGVSPKPATPDVGFAPLGETNHPPLGLPRLDEGLPHHPERLWSGSDTTCHSRCGNLPNPMANPTWLWLGEMLGCGIA
ncbi:uncharacterized mitochondrial protein-like protein [Tanacetum coccineum]